MKETQSVKSTFVTHRNMAAAGGGEAGPAERQSIQLSKSTLKGLECQFYGSNTFDTFYPDPSKHKFCPDGKYSAYVLVQDLPESIFKLADRSLSDFEHSDLQRFFDKHLPAHMKRPKCKVGCYEVEEQTGGGSSSKQKMFTGIAEFADADAAQQAIAAMSAKICTFRSESFTLSLSLLLAKPCPGTS